MLVYLLERNLSGITMEQPAASLRGVKHLSGRFAARGECVRYIWTVYVPGDSRYLCRFDASDPETVEQVKEMEKFPYPKISEAVDLTQLNQ